MQRQQQSWGSKARCGAGWVKSVLLVTLLLTAGEWANCECRYLLHVHFRGWAYAGAWCLWEQLHTMSWKDSEVGCYIQSCLWILSMLVGDMQNGVFALGIAAIQGIRSIILTMYFRLAFVFFLAGGCIALRTLLSGWVFCKYTGCKCMLAFSEC